MRHIAIIPARQHSKSIINKNLQKIGSKSLIERTIHNTLKAKIFDKIYLTTDIPVVLDTEHKNVFIHKRPENLCSDDALMKDVCLDVLNIEKGDYWMWVLQPTAPFRLKTDFKMIHSICEIGSCRSVISVCDVGPNHPNRMYTMKGQKLFPLRKTNFLNKQDLDSIYLRSGHFYVCQSQHFRQQKDFFLTPCHGYIIPPTRSVNIDSKIDLTYARILSQQLSL